MNNRFRQGILIGFVLSMFIAIAIALTLSDEQRSQYRQRLEELRRALPGVEQIKQSAQQAASKARETGNHLGEQVQESASTLVQHTQEILGNAQQQIATSLGGSKQTKGTDSE